MLLKVKIIYIYNLYLSSPCQQSLEDTDCIVC